MKISIVIPCLNEEQTIVEAVTDALAAIRRERFNGSVIVADNGSTDASRELATQAGARVVSVSRRGYGACLDGGIRQSDGEVIVMADADLSYPFDQLERLVTPILEDRSDFVLGSRLNSEIEDGAMPFLNRRVGTPILSLLIRALYGLPVSDCNSGMRSFKKTDYLKFNLTSSGMEFASEMLIQLSHSALRYIEVPISFRKDRRNRAPHLKRWRDGWRHLRFIVGSGPINIVIVPPTVAALAGLLSALALSTRPFFINGTQVHYHTAFAALAFAMPFALFALTSFLVKVGMPQSIDHQKALVAYRGINESALPFYLVLGSFALGLVQVGYITWVWYRAGFGEISEIPSLIRLTVFFFAGTLISALDIGYTFLHSKPSSRAG
jgi:Glycosyl transferase family 2